MGYRSKVRTETKGACLRNTYSRSLFPFSCAKQISNNPKTLPPIISFVRMTTKPHFSLGWCVGTLLYSSIRSDFRSGCLVVEGKKCVLILLLARERGEERGLLRTLFLSLWRRKYDILDCVGMFHSIRRPYAKSNERMKEIVWRLDEGITAPTDPLRPRSCLKRFSQLSAKYAHPGQNASQATSMRL